MELSLSHTLHLFNIFREYDEKENCAQVLEEEIYRMFDTKSLNDEHDCNVVSVNSLNIHDANDMQSHKLGDAMFDEYDIFSPPSFDENIYYDESMPSMYDDYIDESGFGRVSTLGSSDPTILEDVESYCDEHENGFGRVPTYLVMIPLFRKRFQLIMRTKLLSMMIIVMTCMLLGIMITMKLVIMILVFNRIMPHMIIILLSLLLLLFMRRILLMWRVVNFLCL